VSWLFEVEKLEGKGGGGGGGTGEGQEGELKLLSVLTVGESSCYRRERKEGRVLRGVGEKRSGNREGKERRARCRLRFLSLLPLPSAERSLPLCW